MQAGKPVVFLEQNVYDPVGVRIDRYWDSVEQGPGFGVPFDMVDSGFRTHYGWENTQRDYETVFMAMVDEALERPAGAAIEAYYQRSDRDVTVNTRITNLSGLTLDYNTNGATAHAMVYERTPVVHTNRFVRAALPLAVRHLEPGATMDLDFFLETVPVQYWDRAAVVVLLDYRPDPAGSTRWESLQAAVAVEGTPPTATPDWTATSTATDTPRVTPTPSITPTPFEVRFRAYLPQTLCRN